MERRFDIRSLLARHGLRPKRSWSQNFLVDAAVLERIADACDIAGRPVVELGAGAGALTAVLAASASRVIAVERDREFARLLRAEFALSPTVEVLEANAARLDWEELAHQLGGPCVAVGNLPYHMATPILFSLLEAPGAVLRAVLMLQREMAERLCAEPGTRECGAASVMLQMRADVEAVLDVPPGAFYPAPRVYSRVIRIRPLPGLRHAVRDFGYFGRLVRSAFSGRRKTLSNSLRAFLSKSSRDASDEIIRRAGIDPGLRAEALSLEDWARLSDITQGESQ